MMARTKRSRHSYGAGEWGRNRVRVFPDPKTGLFQIEWRDNGRRLTRSLKHRDWRRAKRQADEFAAGYLGPELHGKAEAEPEPLTLERLFDIYGEEVTPAKVERVRHRDRTATRMFLDFLGRDRRPETLSQRDWDRFIRERRSGRVGPSGKPVANRMIECDLKFLLAVRQVQGRARPPALGSESLERPEDTQGEEPNPGRPFRRGIPGTTPSVPTSRLAVPGRACARARDGAPHRRHPPASVVRHRLRRKSGAVARRAREDRVRTPDAGHRRGARRLGRGTANQPWERGRAGPARALGSLDELQPRAGLCLVEQGRAARGTEAHARKRLALAQAEVCLRSHGPAAQGALPGFAVARRQGPIRGSRTRKRSGRDRISVRISSAPAAWPAVSSVIALTRRGSGSAGVGERLRISFARSGMVFMIPFRSPGNSIVRLLRG